MRTSRGQKLRVLVPEVPEINGCSKDSWPWKALPAHVPALWQVVVGLFLERPLALCQVVLGPGLRAHFGALYEDITRPKTQGPHSGARDKGAFQGFLALEHPSSSVPG